MCQKASAQALRRVFDLARAGCCRIRDLCTPDSSALPAQRARTQDRRSRMPVSHCRRPTASSTRRKMPSWPRVAELIGVPPTDYLAVRRAFVHDPDSPYQVLGLIAGGQRRRGEAALSGTGARASPRPARRQGLAGGIPGRQSGRRLAAINAAYEAILAERGEGRRSVPGAGALTLPKPNFKPDSRLVKRVHPAHKRRAAPQACPPSLVILHYTGMASAEKAIDWLARAESRVSCHYVVDETGQASRNSCRSSCALGMPASRAGRARRTSTRSSIGIEIHNRGSRRRLSGLSARPDRRRDRLVARYLPCATALPPHGVLAHSDVAIARKIDPGEKFPVGEPRARTASGTGSGLRRSTVRPGIGRRARARPPGRSAQAPVADLTATTSSQTAVLDAETAKVADRVSAAFQAETHRWPPRPLDTYRRCGAWFEALRDSTPH